MTNFPHNNLSSAIFAAETKRIDAEHEMFKQIFFGFCGGLVARAVIWFVKKKFTK